MTPEQKQQLDDLKIRHRMAVFAFEGQEPPQAQKDIDFLLSLVKSQEADSSGGDLLLRREVVERIEKQIRLWNNDTVTMACADMLADLKQLPIQSANVSDQEWALRDLADGFIGSNERSHFNHNARIVLSKISEDATTSMRIPQPEQCDVCHAPQMVMPDGEHRCGDLSALVNAAATEICDYCGIDTNDAEKVAAIIERCLSGGREDQKSTPTGLSGSPL